MQKFTRKIIISVITLSMIAPIATIPKNFYTINANAQTKVHRKLHIHKRYRRIRRIRHQQSRHHYFKIKSFTNQMKFQTLRDINHDRRTHHLKPLSETRPLNRLANMRAWQLIKNFSHYDRHGHTYYKQDAKLLRINLIHYYHNQATNGENIANAILNHGNYVGTYMPQDPKEYQNHNGYNMANMDEDAMFHYDSGSNWGHRKNILNKEYRHIGIGVTHTGSQYYLAEDFDS